MRSTTIIAASSFLALVSATPLAKRARVIKTETVIEEFTMTVDTTTTVMVSPTEAAVAPQENYQQPQQKHGHMHQHLHSQVASAPVNDAPAAVTSQPVQPVLPTSTVPAYVPAPQDAKELAPVPAPVVETPTTPAAPAYTPPKQPSPPAYQPASSPVPTTTPATTPAPTPVPVLTPIPAPSPSQSSSAGSGSSGGSCGTVGGQCVGDITYYEAGLGACGWTNDGSSEDVFALAHGMMGDQSNGNPFCGRMATIKVPGKPAVKAKLVDKCMGCEGQSIDLSNHLFDQLCDEATGRLHNVEWSFTT